MEDDCTVQGHTASQHDNPASATLTSMSPIVNLTLYLPNCSIRDHVLSDRFLHRT
jgi:hypothetical protein